MNRQPKKYDSEMSAECACFCMDCKWAHTISTDTDIYECRRFPPVFIVPRDEDGLYEFPMVDAFSYCGEARLVKSLTN